MNVVPSVGEQNQMTDNVNIKLDGNKLKEFNKTFDGLPILHFSREWYGPLFFVRGLPTMGRLLGRRELPRSRPAFDGAAVRGGGMAADPSAGRGARRGKSGRCCLRASWGAAGIPAAAVVDVEPEFAEQRKSRAK